MAHNLYVASRKGLLFYAEESGNWRLVRTSFVGEPVTAVLADPRDGTLYAALNLGHFGVKLHRSDDHGATWQELPAPAFPASSNPDNDNGDDGPSVELIWTLVAGGADQPGRLWAGTIPGGLFASTDRGETWTLNESLWNEPLRGEWFGGGYDAPGIHSICVDPRDSTHLILAVSCGGIWSSQDIGETWRLDGSGLRADYMPPNRSDDRVAQDPHRLVQCRAAPEVMWCQHHNGIFRSEDRGATFTEIKAAKPSAFGFAVVVHPDDPATAWFVPAVKDECRVPVDQRMVVSRTQDGGATFEVLSDGLATPPSFDLVYRHALDIDQTGVRMAMGSTTGNLWVGQDGGTRWRLISYNLPPINQVLWAPGI